MHTIKLSPKAVKDLKEIKEYISTELSNEIAANNTVKMIMSKIKLLETSPIIGIKLTNIVSIETDYRFIVCGNYIAFYRYDEDYIYIVRVIYGKRNYMEILFNNNE